MQIKAITNTSKEGTLKPHWDGWLQERFPDHFAQIGTINTLKLRNAVKDVARAILGRVPPDIEQWCKGFIMPPQGVPDLQFIMGYHTPEGDVPGSIQTDRNLQDYIKAYPDHWDIVKESLALWRSNGRHAAGYVISNDPIDEFIPTTHVSDVKVLSFSGPECEAVGAIKMDFLVVNSVKDVQQTIKLIQERHLNGKPKDQTIDNILVPGLRIVPGKNGALYDIWDLPEEEAVFADLYSKTETVFQFDSNSARQWMKYFNGTIHSVNDMAVFTALDRPGPLDCLVTCGDAPSIKHNMLVEYARRARGMKGSPDIVKEFDNLCAETKGVMIYQESLMKVYQYFTDCTAAEAEEFRGDVGKKKKAKIEKAYTLFLERAKAKVTEQEAQAVWDSLITFAAYGFNKTIVGTTILNLCDGTQKQIKDIVPGDTVYGVDQDGNIIQDTVVALHDHGELPGFKVTFDDGYSVTTSAAHKFLTEQGQIPLYQIVENGLEVLSSAQKTDGGVGRTVRSPSSIKTQPGAALQRMSTLSLNRRGQTKGKGRKNRGLRSKVWKACYAGSNGQTPSSHLRTVPEFIVEETKSGWLENQMRGHGSHATSFVGTLQSLREVHRDKESQYSKKADGSQYAPGTETSGQQSCNKNVPKKGPAITAGSKLIKMAKVSSRRSSSHMGEGSPSSQKIENGKMAEGVGDFNLVRCSNSVWRHSKTSRFRKREYLGRSRRVFPLLQYKKESTTKGTRKGSDIEGRGYSEGVRHVNKTVYELLSVFGRQATRPMEGLAFSDAPISNSGGLVRRKILRVDFVGKQRMYDIEVSSPKHNFCLPNGVITSNSHAVSYCKLAYACLWLKHHYPLEWWCGVLRGASKEEINDKFWKHCGNMVLLPDIKLSKATWEIEGDKIRAPISMLYGMGETAHKQLSAGAPYDTLESFCQSIVDHQKKNSIIKDKEGKDGTVTKVKCWGRSALDIGKIYSMLYAGCLDSIFGNLTVSECVDRYHETMKQLYLKEGKKYVKSKKKLASLDILERYQAKKDVLPPYGADLRLLLTQTELPEFLVLEGRSMRIKHKVWSREAKQEIDTFDPVVGGTRLDNLELSDGFVEQKIVCGIIAFVEDKKCFNYGPNKEKQAAKFFVEVEGRKREFVYWPDKEGNLASVAKNTEIGSIVALVIDKSSGRTDFNIRDIFLIKKPLESKEDKDGKDKGKGKDEEE